MASTAFQSLFKFRDAGIARRAASEAETVAHSEAPSLAASAAPLANVPSLAASDARIANALASLEPERPARPRRSQRLATTKPATQKKPAAQQKAAPKKPAPKKAAAKKPASACSDTDNSSDGDTAVPSDGDMEVPNDDDIPAGQVDVSDYTDEQWETWLTTETPPKSPLSPPKSPLSPGHLPSGSALRPPRTPSPPSGSALRPPRTPSPPAAARIGKPPRKAAAPIIPLPQTPETLKVEVASNSDMNFDEITCHVCCKCKEPVCPLRAYGKSPATWRCSGCNVKCVGLYKKYGRWPTPEFEEFNDEEKETFYKGIKNKSMADAEKKLMEKVLKKRRDWEENKFSGEWLPLSVWGSQGFVEKDIKDTADATNSKPSRRFGMLYRVFVETDGKGTVSERERISELKATLCKAKTEKQEKGTKRHGDNIETGESKKRKLVEEEIAKKTKEATEREEKRATDADAVRAKKDAEKRARLALQTATKTIAKCTPLQEELGKLQKDKKLEVFGDFVVNKISAAKVDVDCIQKESKQALAAKKNHTISFSMEDVQRIAGEASEAIKLAHGMLKTLKGIKK